ncbi:hypothetical protein BKA69DRAFT_1036404 [Paraphysoderma sedebokerense]|nr:hypothetical protein BKA69DRAFT_1036404 [Paraphysoderma sedebokerense]
MSDIDDEILALLGDEPAPKSKAKSSKSSKKKPEKSRKSSRSSKSSKKRKNKYSESDSDSSASFGSESGELSASGSDDDVSSSSNSESEVEEDIWGEDLMGDDEDRKRLMALPEVEREQILMERAEKRQMIIERQELKKKLKAGRSKKPKRDKERDKGLGGRDKRSKRTKEKTERKQRLEELSRKKREKHKKSERGESPPRKRRRGSWSDSDEEVQGDGEHIRVESDSDDYKGYEDREKSKRKEKDTFEKEEPITLEDLQSIRITRDQLEKWCYAPFFEETVVGSFVRVNIGLNKSTNEQIYRICEVVGVTDYHRTYKLGNLQLKKALTISHGQAQRVFLMDIVSNSDFTMREFRRWKMTMETDKLRLPSKQAVLERKTIISRAINHVFTNEEITAMLQLKKSIQQVPKNIASTKADLLRLKSAAQAQGDLEEANRLNEEISKLDLVSEERKRKVNAKLEVWSKLNERNRKINEIESRQAEERISKLRNSPPKNALRRPASQNSQPSNTSSAADKNQEFSKAFDLSLSRSSTNGSLNGDTAENGNGETGATGAVRSNKLEELFADVDFDL